jgi:hypothetical protein
MSRKLGLIGILLVVLVAFGTTPASAQVQTGTIYVKAVDEQGSAVPGATVTLTGPVLPRPLTGVTDSSGVHQFPALSLGTYTVSVTLQGFQTINRENIVVVQNQTTPIELQLKVGAVSEVITVKGETPVVDSKNVRVNVNLDSMLLETTPGGKDIWNILEYKIPGLVFDTPDVGGNQAGLQRGFTARGTPNSQNVQLVNGVNVGDPAAIGFSMNYYEPSTFENISVTTGAQDISMGTSGTLINMVTRSGTNRFGGQTLGTYQGEKTQWDNIDETLKLAGFRPEANSNVMTTNFNFQAGGPFIANKLFYFGSLNDQRTHVNVPGYPAVSPPQIPQVLDGNTQDTTDIFSFSGKLTYALNGSNRFEAYGNRQWYDKPNRGASATVTLDSNTKEYDTFVITQASWNSVVTDRLFGDTKLAYSNTHFPLTQKHDDLQSISDNLTGVRSRNSQNSAMMFRRRLQFTSNWNYYIPELLGGRHEFKFGFDNGYTPETVDTTRVDDVNLTFCSALGGNCTGTPGARNVTIFNSPLEVKRAVNNTAVYGQDAFAIGRLNLVAGVRWERVEGFLPSQVKPVSKYFAPGMLIQGLNVQLNTGGTLTEYLVPETFAEVHNAPNWTNWAPRVSGTYDLHGTGKTVLKASVGKYLDQIGTGTPGPNPNGTVSQQYTWNDANGDLIFQDGGAVWNGTRYVGGEFGNLNANQTTIPNPNPFDQNRRRTYRMEGTAGVDHELAPGLGVSATYIYRREYDSYVTVESNVANWDNMYTQINVLEPGRDGVRGTADDQTLTVYNQNTGVTLVTNQVNDDRVSVRYNGIELIGNKRYANGLTFLAGYTFSHEYQELPSLSNPNAAYVNAAGISGGRRHNFKAIGSYMFPYRITFGANFRISSGLPITRNYTVPACSATVLTDCLSQGGNNGTNVNAEERGSVELPALATLDMRAGRIFNLSGQRVEVSMDVYNVMNANTTYSVRQGTGLTNVRYANDPTQPQTQIATFMSPTGVLGPRIIRFNVTYWFGTGTSAAGRR